MEAASARQHEVCEAPQSRHRQLGLGGRGGTCGRAQLDALFALARAHPGRRDAVSERPGELAAAIASCAAKSETAYWLTHGLAGMSAA